ncbi:MAG: hypothetical protein AAFO87_00695 [Cyanobacteria bacterium J06607_6]
MLHPPRQLNSSLRDRAPMLQCRRTALNQVSSRPGPGWLAIAPLAGVVFDV